MTDRSSWVVIALVTVLLACMAVIRAQDGAGLAGKVTETIALKHTSTSCMMLLLGARTSDCLDISKHPVWSRDTAVSPTRLVPPSVESLRAGDDGRSLIVVGARSGIDDLKTLVGQMDVETRKVVTTVDAYEIEGGAAKRVLSTLGRGAGGGLTSGAVTKDALVRVKAQLGSLGVAPTSVLAASLTGFSVRLRSGLRPHPQFDVIALPRVNADNSVTVRVVVTVGAGGSANGMPAMSSQSLSTTRRMAGGESLAVVQSGKGRVLVLFIASMPLD